MKLEPGHPVTVIQKAVRGNPTLIAALVLTAAHFPFLVSYFAPASSGPDANGYFPQARLIAQHGRTGFTLQSPLQFVGPHWLRSAGGHYYSHYPPGLSLILAVPFKLIGPNAAFLVNPVLTSLTLLGLFMVVRLWIGAAWGLVAQVAMAVNPVANTFAFAGDAHAAAAFFLIWGIYLLARWSQTPSPLLAFAAGLWLGVIPAIRYPEALFGVAVGIFMILHRHDGHRAQKSLPAALIGALIPVSCLLLRNHRAFGAFWTTGYSLTNEQTAFAWSYFIQNAVPYLQHILSEGAGLFTALGLAGLSIILTRPDTRRQGVLLTAIVLPITLLYMAYYFSGPGMAGATMRFLLPTFYIYTLAGVWCLKILSENHRRGALAATVTMLAVTLCWGLPQSVMPLRQMHATNAALADAGRTVAEHVQPGAVVIAPSSIAQHLNTLGQWRLADDALFHSRRSGPMRPPFSPEGDGTPRPMQVEERRERMARYADADGLSGVLLDDLNAWAQPGRKVYWIGDMTEMADLVPPSDSLKVVAEIVLSRADEPLPGPGGFGRRRRPGGMARGPMGGRFPRPGGPPGGMAMGPLIGGAMGGQMAGDLVLAEWSWTSEERR